MYLCQDWVLGTLPSPVRQVHPVSIGEALGEAATLVAAAAFHHHLDVDSCSALRYSSTLLLSTNVDPVSTNVGKGENEFDA